MNQLIESSVKQNLIDRVLAKQNCEQEKVEEATLCRASAFELCKRGILNFFKYFLWTYDPRNAEMKDMPFIPWDYQEKYITELNDDIKSGTSSLTEKSRDMGVTWMILGVFLYRWLFFDESFLLGSRKEELVDKIGDIDTHFERLRYMIDKIPLWMLQACNFNTLNSSYLKIYKSNGACLVGESMNKDFSRQGRYKAILLDEFAFVEGAEVVWRACGDSAPCKLPVSTPNGRHNFFAMLRESGKIKVHTLHWKQHPHKDTAWYIKQTVDRSAKDVAQELDINYTVSAGEPFYNGFSRGLHLRKMNINHERPLILSWDFGFTHPNCVINQITTEGIWVIVDNIFGENQTIEEFGQYVASYLNQKYFDYSFQPGFCDPAGSQSSDKSRLSSIQILESQGWEKLRYIPSNSAFTNYAARKAIIERKLKTLIGGIPALVVNDTLNNYIIVEGFEGGYRYPDATKHGGIREMPLKEGYFEHPFNAIEYFAVNMFKVVDKKKEESKYRLRRYEETTINAGIGF